MDEEDLQIQQLRRDLVKRYQDLLEMNLELLEKDREKSESMDELDLQIQQLQRQLFEKDQELLEKDQELLEMNREIFNKKQELLEKDQELARLKQVTDVRRIRVSKRNLAKSEDKGKKRAKIESE